MGKVRVAAFTISLDGYGAGPNQSLQAPMGAGAERLHEWFVGTRTFQAMLGHDGGSQGVGDEFARASMANVGAWIMGRNMFGPVRGPWPDHAWRGWWGDEPPYRCSVFVLTHHERPSFSMEGGTEFHFVTDGPFAALERARAAAGERDVRIGGGVSTIRTYLAARLIDEMHLACSPVLLGAGEPLFTGLDLPGLGYAVAHVTATPEAQHVILARSVAR